jgi:hypothetical protein
MQSRHLIDYATWTSTQNELHKEIRSISIIYFRRKMIVALGTVRVGDSRVIHDLESLVNHL